MPRNVGKARSGRKPLRHIPNINGNINIGEGNFSKSVKEKKKPAFSGGKSGDRCTVTDQDGEDEFLDRILLVQSDLSSLTRQIDQLVAETFKLKAITKEGRKEIECFTHVLSDMLSSLKPWVPRFQKVLSSPSMEPENQRGLSLKYESVSALSEKENIQIDSPEETKMVSLVSPSPLVSWRADCNIERGRQLFLLTPLPIMKTLSSKCHNLPRSVFERIATDPAVELPSFPTILRNENDDSLESVGMKATLRKPSDSVLAETKSITAVGDVSTPMLPKRDQSVLVMTPFLRMSPPKSCVLLEPIAKSSQKGNDRTWKSTPFPVGKLSQISESSGSEGSDYLALKYPELLGINMAYKSRIGKKDLEASPNWSFSPLKSCVLLEPADDKSQQLASCDHFSIKAPALNQQVKINSSANQPAISCHQIRTSCNPGLVSGRLTPAESPMWNEPASAMRTGKRPGENTLKRELWTKFDAASSYGLRFNPSVFQGTAKKGFLDMLDEASCDGERVVAESLR